MSDGRYVPLQPVRILTQYSKMLRGLRSPQSLTSSGTIRMETGGPKTRLSSAACGQQSSKHIDKKTRQEICCIGSISCCMIFRVPIIFQI